MAMKKNTVTAPRNLIAENQLCEAIKQKRVVRLRYENDFTDRVFHPYIIYQSQTGKILVHGLQIQNMGSPFDQAEPHKFEIGKISSIQIMPDAFSVDIRFDRNRKEYVGRTICVVS